MGKYNDISIKKVMEEINEKYFLPDLQREFVWLSNEREKKIEKLFDSILRGYPINSFLFWKLNKEDIASRADSPLNEENKLNFQLYKFILSYDVRKPHNEKLDIEQVNRDELFVVLDGQQRLTSLAIGLSGSRILKRKYFPADNPDSYEEKWLYLNLRYEPDNEDPDDMYEFKFLTPEEAINDASRVWFRLNKLLGIKDIFQYVVSHEIKGSEASLLNKLYHKICEESLITFFEEDDKELDKVLNIFIRINSGGLQLSYSDLLMSILTSSFTSDIRERINEETDYAKRNGYECFGRDQLLKTALFLIGANHKFTLKNFNKSVIYQIEKNLDTILSSIRTAMRLVTDMGFSGNLTSGYIITIIAYWLFQKNLSYFNVSQSEFKAMTDFVRTAQLMSYFTTSLDNKLNNTKDALQRAQTFKEFLENMSDLEAGKSLRVTEQDIEDFLSYRYGKQNVLPLLQILYPKLNYKISSFHIDHIYPQSKFKGQYKDLRNKKDYIWNLQLLEGIMNQEKNAKNPEEWLKDQFLTTEGRISYLRNNFIDEDFILTWENFPQFEEMRKNKIKKELMRIFKINGIQ